MAIAWVDLGNETVAVGAPLNTFLMTAFRDRTEGLAGRAAGAPKILGNAYNYQEFLTSGTWIKPANAESGDVVYVQVVAGGASGDRENITDGFGGGGGAGVIKRYEDVDLLGASETIVVGAGAAGGGGRGNDGGDSSFGTEATVAGVASPYILAGGGRGGDANDENSGGYVTINGLSVTNSDIREQQFGTFSGGHGGGYQGLNATSGGSSVFGGGGGGRNGTGDRTGGLSAYAGNGGVGSGGSGNISDVAIDGEFPGGGGGGVNVDISGDTRGGNGADGVVRVWCVKEQ